MTARRILLVPLLLAVAVVQSGCEGMCTTLGAEWGVAGCGETEPLNRPPKLRNLYQSTSFPEVGGQVFFDVTARDDDGDALTFEWDFEGDGRVDELESFPSFGVGSADRTSRVNYRFFDPGIARFSVRVSDFPDQLGAPGEDRLTKRFRVHTLAEFERDQPPVPAFTVGADQSMQFSTGTFDASASTDPDGDQLMYSWRRLPDSQYSGLLTSPIFSPEFKVAGPNEWQLTVWDEYGKTASTSRSVDVIEADQAPNRIGINIEPYPVFVGEAVNLTADASDPNDDIDHYEWDLDGQPGYELALTDPRTTHVYTTPGQHTVRLRVVDRTGLSISTGKGFDVQRRGGAPNPPNALLDIDPNPARTGEPVTLDASDSTGPAPETARYQWDADGDGVYESETPEPVVEHVYTAAGDYTVWVRVIHVVEGQSLDDYDHRVLRVDAAPSGEGPTARLEIDPNPATRGQTVTFSASGSTDPTGDIASYEWDLDGFPGYEVEPTSPSEQQRSYDDSGTFVVRVRVTDAAGNSDVASRRFEVGDGGGARVAAARTKRPARPFSARLTARTGPLDRSRAGFEFAGLGRLEAKLAKLPKLTSAERTFKRFLGAKWRSKPRVTLVRGGRRARVGAVALATRGRDRACVRIDVDLQAGKLPRGTFKILGGTGAGARLHGSGSFRFQIPAGGPATVLGHLRAARGRPRGLPAACRRLARPVT